MRALWFPLALLLLAPGAVDGVRFEGWGRHELGIQDRKPVYLDRAALLALPVPPPPANSAAETRAELDELLRLQATRTRAQEQAIQKHRAYPGVLAALMEVVQRDLDDAPRTRALLERIDHDALIAVFHAKKRFDRARPHQLEPRIKPSIPVPAHAAYPSGHAMQGWLAARVLALVFPGFEKDLRALGAEIGRERERAGLHYPSDSAASRALADQIFARLQDSPAFKRDLAAARGEWVCRQ